MTKRNSRHAIHKYEGRRSLWARNPITIQVKSCNKCIGIRKNDFWISPFHAFHIIKFCLHVSNTMIKDKYNCPCWWDELVHLLCLSITSMRGWKWILICFVFVYHLFCRSILHMNECAPNIMMTYETYKETSNN